jgi:hypothetical protein
MLTKSEIDYNNSMKTEDRTMTTLPAKQFDEIWMRPAEDMEGVEFCSEQEGFFTPQQIDVFIDVPAEDPSEWHISKIHLVSSYRDGRYDDGSYIWRERYLELGGIWKERLIDFLMNSHMERGLLQAHVDVEYLPTSLGCDADHKKEMAL